MFNLSKQEFLEYKRSGKTFPIFTVVNSDEITPISIFYNLRGSYKFLLESVYSEKEIGRYSFIGSDPYMEIKSYGDKVTIESLEDGSKGNSFNSHIFRGKVLDIIRKYMAEYYLEAGLSIPFTGGAVGYVGYDVIRQYEKLENVNRDDLKLPEANLMFYKTFICYDHFKHASIIVYNVLPGSDEDYEDITERLIAMRDTFESMAEIHEYKETEGIKEFKSNIDEPEFCSMVEKAKSYIEAGEIFQVVLSQRFSFKTNSMPFDVFRRLRKVNPSPYLFYIDFGEYQIAGSSPESLAAVKGNIVTTNPIAGTRPRGKNDEEDLKFKKELLEDPKERAEHVMLVDLGRNDIGKISSFGSVKLDRFMEVDFYSHVMHIVSMVSGRLKKGMSCFDALISCLPVGTVSGAPKIRAMEIIDELESTKRGIYAGGVGYFSYNGNMDTCIGIRTIIFKGDNAYVQAGAGIVFDSVPESEYRETINKAMGMKEVI